MPKPACVRCQRFFRPKRNGIFLTESMPRESHAEPGTAEPNKWQPYKVWSADLWACEGCGTEIISGWGHNPVSVQHMPDFAEKRIGLGADKLNINDC